MKLDEMILDMSGKWKEDVDGMMMSKSKKHFSMNEQQVIIHVHVHVVLFTFYLLRQ